MTATRAAEPIYLGVVCVGVWMNTMMTDQLQQISGIEQEQNWS